ncbi:MAG: asparagine synthetase B [Owenweeksia sp.]|nr:asparagine synthetase B [Owenweeksia sp.]|tara:strand:+ start:4806 stop:6092 length:1287 start_codon:yes stop_codon:yes gene_type:complete
MKMMNLMTGRFRNFLVLFLILLSFSGKASYLLIPMDEETQTNHLKAYGMAYWVLQQDIEIEWLLNYRGGSFLLPYNDIFKAECQVRNIAFEVISDGSAQQIRTEISSPAVNMEVVKLEKAPKIAVYSPKSNQPWDDAVTLVLTYAEIPYDLVYDEEVLSDVLPLYDWLHLHHEDFTGQYGRFYAAFRNAPWYIQQKKEAEADAHQAGYSKVSQHKLAVAKKIKEYTVGGGFLFAMCSATDSYDIALAAEGVDICEPMFDGDPAEPNYQNKLQYSKTFAFKDFQLIQNPLVYEFSDIDVTQSRKVKAENDFFTLFDFSAKWDVVPTMLCQNHTRVVKGFMGQTTAFKKSLIKSDVLIMGELKSAGEARYVHGELGKGTWTFYGGHDPEDYQHRVGDPKTELELYPNSPGYRLILNNILFPAARKKKQKT